MPAASARLPVLAREAVAGAHRELKDEERLQRAPRDVCALLREGPGEFRDAGVAVTANLVVAWARLEALPGQLRGEVPHVLDTEAPRAQLHRLPATRSADARHHDRHVIRRLLCTAGLGCLAALPGLPS